MSHLVGRAAQALLPPPLYRLLTQENLGDIARSAAARRRWLRALFLECAGRFVPALGVDDHRGNRYYFSPTDLAIGRSVFLYGQFDASMLANALTVLAERGTVPTSFVDIGANIGTTTIELLSRFPEATAVAFEPDPVNFALLAQNVLANGLGRRVTIHQLALSDVDGPVEMERSADNPGDHRVRVGGVTSSGRFDESHRATFVVDARRLDTLCDQGLLSIDADTMVCLDVQGHEAQVLSGGTCIFLAGAPIALEFWPYGLDRAGGYERLLELFEDCSAIFDISRSIERLRYADVARLRAHLEDEVPDYTDLLALPNRSDGGTRNTAARGRERRSVTKGRDEHRPG